jgi:hypothetical protein
VPGASCGGFGIPRMHTPTRSLISTCGRIWSVVNVPPPAEIWAWKEEIPEDELSGADDRAQHCFVVVWRWRDSDKRINTVSTD